MDFFTKSCYQFLLLQKMICVRCLTHFELGQAQNLLYNLGVRPVFVCAFIAISSSLFAQVTSTFNTTDEGWKSNEWTQASQSFAGNAAVAFDNTEGQPSGCIKFTDVESTWFNFSAPAAYLGNQSDKAGGEFSFDMRLATNLTLNTMPYTVALKGATATYYYKSPVQGPTFWHRFRIPLLGSYGWRKNNESGALATDIEFAADLSNVQMIAIMGDYGSGTDTTKIDNVRFGTPLAGSGVETFDVNANGWARVETVLADTTIYNAVAVTPAYSAAGGNPGGCITFTDVLGTITMFQSNGSLTGNWSSHYGGTLQWDLKTTGPGTVIAESYPFATMTGGGLTLEYVSGPLQGYLPTTFSPFAIPLTACDRWRVGKPDGPVATANQIQTVLRHIDRLWIRAEYRNGDEVNSVDNVRYIEPTSTVVTGHVDLGPEYVGPYAGMPISVLVNRGDCPLEEVPAVLDAAGNFSATITSKGSVRVGIKASHWLRKNSATFTSVGSPANVSVSLLNGDCDGNNLIGTDDYLIINGAFDTSQGDGGFNAAADLTGDGYVGTDDYLVMNDNFDASGD